MKIKTATTIFEVLASEVRLSIFRLLVKYAPEGLVAGEISQMLDIPKTNLSFHLKNIMYSGLVSMEREGRNTRYRANIPLMLETIAYLASECCSGNSAHCQPYLAEGGIEPEFLSVYCQKQTYDTEITTMDTADKTKSSEDVKETVRAGYAAIATGQRSCCCSSQRGSQADPARLAAAVGYDAESLAKLPDGANMGLSCGNPVAIAALREGQTVVDLGSGGGFDVFQAGEKVKASGRVIGVDMTPEMLAKARKNIGQYRQRTGLDNVEFRLGEIECLPVPDNSVDVVLSNCVINISPDKTEGLAGNIPCIEIRGQGVRFRPCAAETSSRQCPGHGRCSRRLRGRRGSGRRNQGAARKSGVHIHSADAQARLCAEHAGLERSSVQTNSGNASARRGNGRLCGQPVHRSPKITKKIN